MGSWTVIATIVLSANGMGSGSAAICARPPARKGVQVTSELLLAISHVSSLQDEQSYTNEAVAGPCDNCVAASHVGKK